MSRLLRSATCLATGVALFAAPAAVAAPWSAPVTVDDSPVAASTPNEPELASDAAGNLTAAWIGGGGETRAVYVSTKLRGGKWTAAKQVSGSSPQGISELTLSVNDEGAAITGWVERDGLWSNVLRSSTRTTPTGTWSAPVAVQPAAPAGSAVPRTEGYALDLIPGGAVAVWRRVFREQLHGDETGEESGGGFLSFAGAASWAAETSPAISKSQLGVDGEGKATLVNVLPDGTIVASTRPVGGAWSTPQVIATPGDDRTDAAALGVNARGEAVLAWIRSSDELNELRVVRRSAAGTWGAPVTLAVAGNSGLFDASAAIDASGRATVTWARFSDSASEYTSSLETSSAPADGNFTSPTPITTWQRPAGNGSVAPGLQFSDLSVGPAGQALVTWIKKDQVQAATRSASGWSTPEDIARITEWSDAFDGELTAEQTATVLVAGGAAVKSVSKSLSAAPQPSGRALAVSASLASWTGRCPLTVTAYGNGRTAKIPAGLRGSTRSRCIVGGTIPQPASAKVGSSALVLISGADVLPAVVSAKVIAVN